MHQALVIVHRFLAGLQSPARRRSPGSKRDKLSLAVSNMMDELLASLPTLPGEQDRIALVHLCQRPLQVLAVATKDPAVQHAAISMLNRLNLLLPQYFNWDEEAPDAGPLVSKLRASFKRMLQAHPAPLVNDFLVTLDENILTTACSWRTLHVASLVAEELTRNPVRKPDPLALAVKYNLNHTEIRDVFVRHYLGAFDDTVPATPTLKLQLRQLNQLFPLNDLSLQPALPSLKHQLYEWLTGEIEYREAVNNSVAAAGAAPKITTSLSVSQLAAFLKLLVTAKIISCSNQSQLLAMIAAHISTTNAASVSIRSLRNKYYDTGLSTVSSLKDICINLLNHARSSAG